MILICTKAEVISAYHRPSNISVAPKSPNFIAVASEMFLFEFRAKKTITHQAMAISVTNGSGSAFLDWGLIW